MLPDLPGFKGKLSKALIRLLESEAARHAPLMAEIGAHRQWEGDRYSYETHEGDVRAETFKTLRTPISLSTGLSPVEQAEEVSRKLTEASKDVAKQHTKLLFTTVGEACERAGTAFSAAGRPFHMSMYLDALETMWVDFDEDGEARLPTIVMHPSQMKAIEPHLKEWEADPALRARWKRVIARKKEEWRARESHRKLAG